MFLTNKTKLLIAITGIILALNSCKVYDSSIMFRTERTVWADSLGAMKQNAEQNYKLQANDVLHITVATNKGELLVDPNMQMRKDLGAGIMMQVNHEEYVVMANGIARFPMVGDVNLLGLTIYEADTLLSRLYSNYYEEGFVKLKLMNRRVTVLGSKFSKVVPLPYENMNLLEVLAMNNGLNVDDRANNIRIVRGDLKNPTVILVDLSTARSFTKTDLRVYPGDIIYIEPVRKKAVLIAGDVSAVMSPIITVISLVTTSIALFVLFNK